MNYVLDSFVMLRDFDSQLLEHKRKLPMKPLWVIFMTLKNPICPPNSKSPLCLYLDH